MIGLRRVPGRIVWRLPLRFGIASLLGPEYALRCVLFHDISDRPSPFTEGLGVSLSKRDFEDRIKFLAKHYTPVGLGDILGDSGAKKLPRRPVLVTFDDAYASVALEAGPILERYGIPAVFFVNASVVDNRELATDNLVCYVANTLGLTLVNTVARGILNRQDLDLSFTRVFSEFLPGLSLDARREFRVALAHAAGINGAELAHQVQLYVSSEQLRKLVSSGFEIGNHTYSHVHCRTLTGGDFHQEIDDNRQALEALVGGKVRSFSVPYGYAADLTKELDAHLRGSGHQAVFLVESRMNTPKTDLRRLYRVTVQPGTDADLFGELEILPRVRSLSDRATRKPTAAMQ